MKGTCPVHGPWAHECVSTPLCCTISKLNPILYLPTLYYSEQQGTSQAHPYLTNSTNFTANLSSITNQITLNLYYNKWQQLITIINVNKTVINLFFNWPRCTMRSNINTVLILPLYTGAKMSLMADFKRILRFSFDLNSNLVFCILW